MLHIIGTELYNEQNQRVVLHGFRTVGFINDYPGGWWFDSTRTSDQAFNNWNKASFRHHLQAMKQNFGNVNCIRFFISCDNWRDNVKDKSGTPFRTVMKEALSIANDEGIYVIMCLYNIGKNADTYGNYNPFWNHAFFGGLDNAVDFLKNWMNELKGYPNVLFEIWNEPVLPEFTSGSTTWTRTNFMNGYQRIIAGMRTVSDHIIVINIAWGAHKGRPHMEYFQDSRLQGTNILFDIHCYSGAWGGWNNDVHASSQSAMEAYWRDIGLIDSPVPLVIGELAPEGKTEWTSEEWLAGESILKILKKYPINHCIELWRWGYNYYHLLRSRNSYIDFSGDGYSRWGQLCKRYLQSYIQPS